MRLHKKIGYSLLISCLVSNPIFTYAGNYAYSIGTNYNDGVDTSQSAQDAATDFSIAGYNSYYNIKPTYSYLTGDAPDGVKRLESEVLFFAGHGNYNIMNWIYMQKSSYKCGINYTNDFTGSDTKVKYTGLNNYDMSDTKVAVFAGCLTASESTNLLTKAVSRGAKSAVGFTKKVNTTSATEWRGHFTDGLALGKTVGGAILYADNSFSYDDENVLSSTYKGNSSTTILLSSRALALDDEDSEGTLANGHTNLTLEDTNTLEVTDDVNYTTDLTEISNYITNNLDNNFDLANYKVETFLNDQSYGTIVLTYLLEDFETDIKLKVLVEDSQVTQINSFGSGIALCDFDSLTYDDEDSLKQKAIESDGLVNIATTMSDEQDFYIEEQTITKKLNTETGKAYYYVLTTYVQPESGATTVESYIQYMN